MSMAERFIGEDGGEVLARLLEAPPAPPQRATPAGVRAS
jgi:hypothetical protein